MSKVSIVVPIYNVEKYIRPCLDSLLGQTLSDIEIICVDDCGSDGSMAIVEEYAAKDRRLRILKQATNGGPSTARNIGIAAACASYIVFCDSDDYLAPDMCEKMYNALQSSPGADIAVCAAKAVWEREVPQEEKDAQEEYLKVCFEGEVSISAHVLRHSFVYTWAKIYRRRFLVEHAITFPEGMRYEDAYFHYVCAAHARSLYFLPEPLYYYRIREGSIMDETQKAAPFVGIDHLHIALMLWDYFKKHGFMNKWGGYIYELWSNYLYLAMKYEHTEEARVLITRKVADFLRREKLNEKNMPRLLALSLNKYAHCDDAGIVSSCGGMVKTCETEKERRVYVGGIRLLQEKYGYDHIKRVIFGKRTEYTADFNDFKACQLDNEIILKELKSLEPFTFIPNPGDMGDALTAAATLKFFDEYKLSYELYHPSRPTRDNIVYGGGGRWHSMYEPLCEKECIPLFRKAKRIVILPSGIFACRALVQAMDERYTVFCRDQASYHYLVQAGTAARVYLDHDMALRMNASIFDIRAMDIWSDTWSAPFFRDVVYQRAGSTGVFLRRDRESCCSDIADSIDMSAYYSFSLEGFDVENIYNVAKFMLLSMTMYDHIVTDSLHVGIAAALMGRRVSLLDNRCHKLSSVYHQSLHRFSHVQLAADNFEKTISRDIKDVIRKHLAHSKRVNERYIRNAMKAIFNGRVVFSD